MQNSGDKVDNEFEDVSAVKKMDNFDGKNFDGKLN